MARSVESKIHLENSPRHMPSETPVNVGWNAHAALHRKGLPIDVISKKNDFLKA